MLYVINSALVLQILSEITPKPLETICIIFLYSFRTITNARACIIVEQIGERKKKKIKTNTYSEYYLVVRIAQNVILDTDRKFESEHGTRLQCSAQIDVQNKTNLKKYRSYWSIWNKSSVIIVGTFIIYLYSRVPCLGFTHYPYTIRIFKYRFFFS